MSSLNISKNFFWDLELDNFDSIKNKQIIIERVFNFGDIEDIVEIMRFYGINIIKHEIIKSGSLDKKTLNWASDFLKISKTKFKCFTKKQSNKEHWTC